VWQYASISRMLLRENKALAQSRSCRIFSIGATRISEMFQRRWIKSLGRAMTGPACGAEFRFTPCFWNPAPEDAVLPLGSPLSFAHRGAMIEDGGGGGGRALT